MTDPIIDATLPHVREAFDTLRRVVDGLPAEALNWKPAGDETNSIAVLTTHAMHATDVLLSVATGRPQQQRRNRPAEFAAVVDGASPLVRLIDDLAAECIAILDGAGSVDWSATRERKRSDGEIVESSAAYTLIQAVVHLRGHADEAALTRHMWAARS